MSTKTKWILAGVTTALVVLAIIFWPREAPRTDDQGPAEPEAEQKVAAPTAENKAAFERAIADAPSEGATAISPTIAAAVERHKQTPRVLPYRPARMLVYSEDSVSMNPAFDDHNWALQRILEVTAADVGQAVRIRELWRAHEDGRRFLWMQALDLKSRDRILDPAMLAKLDGAFEADLLNKVLNPDQAVRILAETGRAQP